MITTIDLFCGAGGITEGFRQAGFSCLYGNDFNEWAIRSFARNHEEAWADGRKVEEIDPKTVRKKLGVEKGELDVLCGGPPCQGFSINAPERFLDDPRNILFKHSIRFLDEFQPKTFLLENVPGMLSLADGKIYSLVLKELGKIGYHISVKILFAGHYGVPQERWRLIILGSRINGAPNHPEPTHFAQARANFRGGSTMTFRLLPLDQARLQPAVTVKDAIGDLPKLKMGEGGEVLEYNQVPLSEYAARMRADCDKVYNHYAAKLSALNIERLKFIKPGGSWRDIPFKLLPLGMKKARRSDHTRRYGRLKHDGLSGTIMTKCDPHWGAVFLPGQDRSLTVREAARLQSFPDKYVFLGPRVAQYEQVGNAVPVLMAKAIAGSLKNHIHGFAEAKANG
jgi:DNA (cytosine-5)-methyltransferase 1